MYQLPEKISPGEELEVQLAPLGDWPNVDAKGKKVVQRVTAEAVSRLGANFGGEVLVDVDHDSIGGSTEAAAWVTGLYSKRRLDLIPEAWRNPDRVVTGNRDRTAICEIDTLDGGTLHLVVGVGSEKKRTAKVLTMYKTKEAGHAPVSGPA